MEEKLLVKCTTRTGRTIIESKEAFIRHEHDVVRIRGVYRRDRDELDIAFWAKKKFDSFCAAQDFVLEVKNSVLTKRMIRCLGFEYSEKLL